SSFGSKLDVSRESRTPSWLESSWPSVQPPLSESGSSSIALPSESSSRPVIPSFALLHASVPITSSHPAGRSNATSWSDQLDPGFRHGKPTQAYPQFGSNTLALTSFPSVM